jgi:hypothetical protein
MDAVCECGLRDLRGMESSRCNVQAIVSVNPSLPSRAVAHAPLRLHAGGGKGSEWGTYPDMSPRADSGV